MENELICKCCKNKITKEIRICPFCGNIIEQSNTTTKNNTSAEININKSNTIPVNNIKKEPLKNLNTTEVKENESKTKTPIVSIISLIISIPIIIILLFNILNINLVPSYIILAIVLVSTYITIITFILAVIGIFGKETVFSIVAIVFSILPAILATLSTNGYFQKQFNTLLNHDKNLNEKDSISSKTQINKMREYINKKYNIHFDSEDCIYFNKEDKSTNNFFSVEIKNYIPNIGIFEKDGQRITVIEDNNFYSDDAQLKDIGYMLGNYFKTKTGIDFEYVEVRTALNGDLKDHQLNKILVNKFNEKITEDNISKLVDEILNISYAELIFYVKDNENRTELLNEIVKQLAYLNQHEHVARVMVYLYKPDMELQIKHIAHDIKDNRNSNNYKELIFGYYNVLNRHEHHYYEDVVPELVNAETNTFVASAFYDLDRGYGAAQGGTTYEKINDWQIFIYEQ